jgi:hypothetical protein
MRIEQFRIQGFKSIADLMVEGLSDINVFFGINDVGKSNIFQALELGCWLSAHHTGNLSVHTETMTQKFGPAFFRLKATNLIIIDLHIALDTGSSLSTKVEIKEEPYAPYFTQVSIENTSSPYVPLRDEEKSDLESLRLHIIDAARRLYVEQRGKDLRPSSIDAQNLKQALFYAYLSPDLEQKRRLSAIKRVLAEPPYNLGELDVALDPQTDRIDIGFVRPDGRLPIENLGSGAQQLILVLGQIFLNDHPIIAVEEPEMNLSPQYQEHLMATLRKLMQDPAVKLQQLFISTHSPYLEFTDNFYDVTFDPDSGTQVKRATSEDYAGHFDITPTGPDTGARLNSLNQVKLYEGVIHDLNLQRGDLVIFVKNEAGGWELRSGSQLAKELQTVTNGNNAP